MQTLLSTPFLSLSQTFALQSESILSSHALLLGFDLKYTPQNNFTSYFNYTPTRLQSNMGIQVARNVWDIFFSLRECELQTKM